MKSFCGKILFLNRSDINTDEIIPAKHLTEILKDALKPYFLEDIKLEGFNPKKDIHGTSAIITRTNFGCGSSREHAVWALEANGINMVIAESFARIFRQNMFNCGMMAVELRTEIIEQIFSRFADRQTFIETDFEQATFRISAGDLSETIPFSISPFDRALVETGGWVDFADKNY